MFEKIVTSIFKISFAALVVATLGFNAGAQTQYDPGADDKEIKIGHTGPYSGPASAYGVIGKAISAYFDKVNAEGGINGRRIKFISLDDGYNPSKTVEQARKLVEEDEVLLLFQSLGTAHNSAIRKYMNQKKVPQLFVAGAATKWGDPKNFPWTMGWQPSAHIEARIYAQHLLETRPNAKVGILYQNDDYGKDYLKGIKDGLGDKAKSIIVSELTYEVTDPTIDSQMVSLKASGADTFFNITTPKFAAQAIKKAAEIGWKPAQYLNTISTSASAVMIPAGPENGIGCLTALYARDPNDPQWKDSPELKQWWIWMRKYMPNGDPNDGFIVYGYNAAQTMEQVLKQAGNNLTRANIMKQAANLDLTLPMLTPGVRVKTGPDDFFPIKQMQLARWTGKSWERFGKVYGK